MQEILADVDAWQANGEAIALATVVAMRGSAPRLPGARLFVTRSGRMAGSVSGGCVESDVFERAMQVLDRGAPAMATYGIADEVAFEVGLSCGGTIEVLIEPFVAEPAWQAVRSALEHQRPAALAVGLEPAALLGRKLALLEGGADVGALDRELDADVAAAARGLLPEGGTRVLSRAWHGVEARIFVEAFPPPSHLVIVGATHTAMALCRLAASLGFRVTVVDPRSAYATAERFGAADAILRTPPGEALDALGLDGWSFVVVLTHDPKFDVPAVLHAVRAGARYVGMMGSRRTLERRRVELRAAGVSEAELARVRAPIGLDLGGRVPEEIALAILAEVVAARHGREGGPLSTAAGAIHGRT
ncbi:MAG: XdhC/CoxI family protein [Candidatus Binatia bacterium]